MTRNRARALQEEPMPRLSRALTRELVARLRTWMGASHVTTYTLAVLTGMSRQNLSRWLSGGVRIPTDAANDILDGMRQHADDVAEALSRLEELRDRFGEADSPEDGLRSEFRLRGIRATATFEAIKAAGYRLAPCEKGENS